MEHLAPSLHSAAIRVGKLAIYWGVQPAKYHSPAPPDEYERISQAVAETYGTGFGGRRPDIVLVDEDEEKVLAVVECKHHSGGTDPTSQFNDAIRQVVRYVGDYGEDPEQLLAGSAIAMNSLPDPVSAFPEEFIPPGHPIPIGAGDLIGGSRRLDLWINRVLPS